ncbi:MAG: hypothetical protein HGA63_08895, partial [Syntrophobacteraceae bacterium]|nr:hypothetical protein [Syntrophobacteraceae bacterium]
MKQRFRKRTVCIALVAAILCLSAIPAEAVEQKTQQPQEVPAPPPTVAIPLAEAATRATEVSNLLQTLSAQFAASPAIEAIRKELPGVRGQMDMELAGTIKILGEEPTLETLQAQQKIWHGRKLQTAAWLKTLTERAIHLRDGITR